MGEQKNIPMQLDEREAALIEFYREIGEGIPHAKNAFEGQEKLMMQHIQQYGYASFLAGRLVGYKRAVREFSKNKKTED